VVAHHFELVLLPSDDAALDEDLGDRARRQPAFGDAQHLAAVVRDAGSAPPRMNAGRMITGYPTSAAMASASGTAYATPDGGNPQPDLGHRRLEALAVFGSADRLDAGTDHLDAVRVEHPGFVERDRQVETGLAAERRQERVGPFAFDDPLDRRDVERLDVGGVGELGVGHDRRRIRIHEDDAKAFFAQHPACLCARVVELARLADHDRPAADQENRLEIVAARHESAGPA